MGEGEQDNNNNEEENDEQQLEPEEYTDLDHKKLITKKAKCNNIVEKSRLKAFKKKKEKTRVSFCSMPTLASVQADTQAEHQPYY